MILRSGAPGFHLEVRGVDRVISEDRGDLLLGAADGDAGTFEESDQWFLREVAALLQERPSFAGTKVVRCENGPSSPCQMRIAR